MVIRPELIGSDGISAATAVHVAAQLGLDELWSETRGDPRICVAILDGPVDLTHRCFESAEVSSLPTLAPATADDGPACRHGTHVASLIFGQPGGPIVGIAPACRGLLVPVFGSGTDKSLVLCSQLDLARAILQAVEAGAHVINISGGQFSQTGEPDPMLANAMQACADANVLVVAAAGNDGCECLHVPAALGSALAVGAMDMQGQPLDVSNWGALYRSQGILAPGQNILGAAPGGGVSVKSGTSFATPHVAGVAALLLSLQLKLGRPADAHAVRAALIASALPCDPSQTADCRRFLAGSINAASALNLIRNDDMNSGGVPDMNETITLTPSEATEAVPAASLSSIAPAMAGTNMTRMEDAVVAAEAPPATGPSAATFAARSATDAVTLSDCGCGCGGGGPAGCSCGGKKTTQLVYALGKLGYDFGTEARRDSFVQAMPGDANNPAIPPNPYDPIRMAEYLAANAPEAESLIWTLNLDVTPIYAIVPAGPFAAIGYERLREAFEGQLRRGVELVSIPGTIGGSVRLLSGQVVPVIVPAVRGMFSWATQPLIEAMLGARPKAGAERTAYDKRVGGLGNFLNRVYYDLRNLGLTAQERALNYSATNAFQVRQVLESAAQGDLELDTITVRKSPVCRLDSDCYDIELGFFDPRNTNVANRVYRFTVDVSDVIPVTIGEVRTWSKRT